MNAPALQALRVNPGWAKLPLFDRKGWRRLPFGEFAQSVNERVEPTDAADEPYVGLDALEPGTLRIKRWGKGSDVIGTKLRFRKGDIIFGRRRAYQRKLGVAEFDGICSAHAMVVRAKPKLVLAEFLPFFMMSDGFMKRAVEISVGSLSPTINWRTLKVEEFELPPLEQQSRMSEVFGSIDAAIETCVKLEEELASAMSTAVLAHFSERSHETNDVKQLGGVAEVAYGITLGGHREQLPIEMQYLRVANLLRGAFDLSEIKRIRCTATECQRHSLCSGDVLLVEGHANVHEIGRAAVWEGPGESMLHQNHLIRVRCSPELRPDYLCSYLNSTSGRAYFRARAKSSSGLNTINSTVVKQLPVPVPNLETQGMHLARLARFEDVRKANCETEASLRKTYSVLANLLA